MEDRPDNVTPPEEGATGTPAATSSDGGQGSGNQGSGDQGSDDQGSGMSTGMKVGIGIGILVAALLLILIFMQLAGGGGSGSTPEEATPDVPVAPTATTEAGGEPGEKPGDGIIIIVPTPVPGDPTVTATTGVYIRSGPGTEYAIIGALAAGDTALAVGRTTDGTWWAISMPDSPNGTGWVSGQYVTATDADGVPVVQPPPLPAPTATPQVPITDWKGEYFNNPNMQGEPVLVRNDQRIDFNWGNGSPAPEVPNDQFSARWTMSRNAPKGVYEFSVWVDDGVRIWVNEELIINGWTSGPARNYNQTVEVADGSHNLRVEYFEATGGAMISLSITYRGEGQPEGPVAIISGPTEGIAGEELLFSARGSTVQEGSHITDTEWDFGDGETARGTDATHIYENAGVYSVLLTLVDDRGLTANTTQQVRIGALPEIDTPTPLPTEEPPIVPTEVPTEEPPIVPTEVPTEEPPVVPTEEPTEEVPPEPEPPVANIAGPVEAVVGAPVTFDGSGSTASTPIQLYAWDLGDGTVAEGAVVEHAYAAEGSYAVTLTVTDEAGLSSTVNAVIDVTVGEAVPLPAGD